MINKITKKLNTIISATFKNSGFQAATPHGFADLLNEQRWYQYIKFKIRSNMKLYRHAHCM